MSLFSTAFSSILGIGVDLVDSRRLEKVWLRYPLAFPQRIFTAQERAYAQAQKTPLLCYAKRFAAKEAFAKATGLGIGPIIGWQDVEVVSQPGGQPSLRLSPRCQRTLEDRWGRSLCAMVSLSDEAPYAQALVILLGGDVRRLPVENEAAQGVEKKPPPSLGESQAPLGSNPPSENSLF